MRMYVVKFNDGYYAASQKDYDWNFTKEIEKANFYKTIEGANERKNYCDDYGTGEIIPVDVETKYKIHNTLKDSFNVKDELVKREKARLTKKFKKTCKEDGINFDEFLDEKISKFIKDQA